MLDGIHLIDLIFENSLSGKVNKANAIFYAGIASTVTTRRPHAPPIMQNQFYGGAFRMSILFNQGVEQRTSACIETS
jgi:hypothetical protein